MRLVLVCVVLSFAVSWTSTAIGQPQPDIGDQPKDKDAIGFEVFAGFKRIEKGNPILALEPPLWAAATHAIVVDETELFKGPQYFHILYGGYDGKLWRIGHVRTRDFRTFEPNPRNPIFTPSTDPDAWDCDGVLTAQIIEIGDTYYMLYAGKKGKEWQTGLAKTPKP